MSTLSDKFSIYLGADLLPVPSTCSQNEIHNYSLITGYKVRISGGLPWPELSIYTWHQQLLYSPKVLFLKPHRFWTFVTNLTRIHTLIFCCDMNSKQYSSCRLEWDTHSRTTWWPSESEALETPEQVSLDLPSGWPRLTSPPTQTLPPVSSLPRPTSWSTISEYTNIYAHTNPCSSWTSLNDYHSFTLIQVSRRPWVSVTQQTSRPHEHPLYTWLHTHYFCHVLSPHLTLFYYKACCI